MSWGEFLVQFIDAFSKIVTALAWPMVVLVVFFVCLQRFGGARSANKRKAFFSSRSVETLLNQIETQCQTQGRLSKNDKQRLAIIHYHLQNARLGLEMNDEKRVIQSLAAISSLGACPDRHIPELGFIANNGGGKQETLLPTETKQS